MGERRLELPLLGQSKAEVGLRPHGRRLEFDCALEILLRAARVAEVRQIHQAQVGACRRVTGAEFEHALIRRNRARHVAATAANQR